MKQLRIDGQVGENGKLDAATLSDLWRAVAAFSGRKVTLLVGQTKRKRSDAQNRYLWGVVYAYIAEATGHTPEEVHEAMGLRFRLGPKGRLGVGVISTTELSTVEFEQYVEKVRVFAAQELELRIPLPHESVYESVTEATYQVETEAEADESINDEDQWGLNEELEKGLAI